MRKHLILMVLAVMAAQPSLAAENKGMTKEAALEIAGAIHWSVSAVSPKSKDKVLAELARCLDAHSDNAGMNGCLSEALKKYDQILNVVYKHVMSSANNETAEALLVSQRKWVEYRSLEKKARMNYSKNNGSIMGAITQSNDMMAIRQRIAELMMYTNIDVG